MLVCLEECVVVFVFVYTVVLVCVCIFFVYSSDKMCVGCVFVLLRGLRERACARFRACERVSPNPLFASQQTIS